MSKDNSKVLFSTSINKNLRDRFKIQCVLKGKYQNEVLEELIEKWLEEEARTEDCNDRITTKSEFNESDNTSEVGLTSDAKTNEIKKLNNEIRSKDLSHEEKEEVNNDDLKDVEIPECYDF